MPCVKSGSRKASRVGAQPPYYGTCNQWNLFQNTSLVGARPHYGAILARGHRPNNNILRAHLSLASVGIT